MQSFWTKVCFASGRFAILETAVSACQSFESSPPIEHRVTTASTTFLRKAFRGDCSCQQSGLAQAATTNVCLPAQYSSNSLAAKVCKLRPRRASSMRTHSLKAGTLACREACMTVSTAALCTFQLQRRHFDCWWRPNVARQNQRANTLLLPVSSSKQPPASAKPLHNSAWLVTLLADWQRPQLRQWCLRTVWVNCRQARVSLRIVASTCACFRTNLDAAPRTNRCIWFVRGNGTR